MATATQQRRRDMLTRVELEVVLLEEGRELSFEPRGARRVAARGRGDEVRAEPLRGGDGVLRRLLQGLVGGVRVAVAVSQVRAEAPVAGVRVRLQLARVGAEVDDGVLACRVELPMVGCEGGARGQREQ